MKNIIIFNIVFFLFYNLEAQNLLRDRGFENHFNCPSACTSGNFGRIENNLNIWKGAGSAGYFHYCGDMQCPSQLASGIPINAAGYQLPLSDSGYIALYALWDFTVTDYRGFAFQVLQQQIEVGRKYWVEYYTSLGDSADYAVGALGASFRMDTLNSNSPSGSVFRRPFKMEHNGSPITNKEIWQQLNWIYEADSAYQTFVIGYARGTNQIANDTLFVGSQCNWCEPLGNFSFYYVENAGVFPIISNNQTLQVCNFPQTLQGAVGNDIWFSQWGSDTTQANTLQIYGPGTYTQTWRTDTTVHIDSFFVEALLPQGNFFTNDTVPMAIGGSVLLNGPTGFAYLWSNNQISQSITIDTPGTYWLMITDESGCNRYDTVVVRYDTTVAELLQFKDQEFDIYPNPAIEKISIKNNTKQAIISLEIYASNGQKILQTQLKNKTEIDVSEWNNGLYFLKFVALDGSRLPLIKKFVVGK
jgi:hypothetical protein